MAQPETTETSSIPTFSDVFSANLRQLEEDKSFEKLPAQSFETVFEMRDARNGRTLDIRLYFDTFIPKDKTHCSWDECKWRIIACFEGCPIGTLRAFTYTRDPIRCNGEDGLGNHLKKFILKFENIEVGKHVQRGGLGRAMVLLMLSRAKKFKMGGAEVFPYSFRGDGRLANGEDKARVFWKSFGFKRNKEEIDVVWKLRFD